MAPLSVPINEEIMARGTWRDVLDHAVQRAEVMDEVNAVTSLHRAAKLWREMDAGSTPPEEVRQAAGLQCLLELVRHFVMRCRPQQLSNAVWACAVLLIRDAELLQLLCDFAVRRLSLYTCQNVANTVWALATLGFQHEALLDLVPLYVEAQFRGFTPQDLANMCWAFARLQRPCDQMFNMLVREALVKLDTFQAQNMSNLVWGCATVLYRDEAAMHTIASSGADRVEEFSPQELSNFTWGMATLNLSSDIWLERSGAEMARRSRECCPQDLSNTIWAYGTLLHKCNEHLRAINWEVMRQIEWFSPQGLSNVTWGLSAIEYRDIKALTCISEEVIRRPIEQFMPPDISTLLYSFAVLAWMHEGALVKLRRAVRRSLPIFATRDVANVSWAMVTLSHRDDHIFQRLMDKSVELMPEFSVQGLCNIAWAFVRFGLEVPAETARGIAQETVQRRAELTAEPGDAILLSDAVCSEWEQHVPRALFDECDAVGREHYNTVLAFLSDWSNIPGMSCSPGEAERYESRLTGFKIIQLGRRLSVELLRQLRMLEDSQEAVSELRVMRERWLLEELDRVEPTDATMQHKTTCTWALQRGDGRLVPCAVAPQVLASGTAMSEEVRFVSCVVEHPRAVDAEFQVVNKAADRLLGSGAPLQGGAGSLALRLDVSEIPCLSCLGALRQFQKAFPDVAMRASFNIRKVSDFCRDCSAEALADREEAPPRRAPDRPPATVPDNRGRGAAAPRQPAPLASQSRPAAAPHQVRAVSRLPPLRPTASSSGGGALAPPPAPPAAACEDRTAEAPGPPPEPRPSAGRAAEAPRPPPEPRPSGGARGAPGDAHRDFRPAEPESVAFYAAPAATKVAKAQSQSFY